MDKESLIVQFNRSKIYEKLEYLPQPIGYSSAVSWIVQNQIAATNGIHYVNRIGKLKNYPEYKLPVDTVSGDKLMLDIGSGWGRWLVSGSNKGYIPIGIDIRLEFCETQQNVLKDMNKTGYSVVGDLENLPFGDSCFDLVWSFSVIQHTHYDRLVNCLKGIDSVLNKNGFTLLEFPNKNGIRNKRNPDINNNFSKDDFNSWCVRYYTPDEYKAIFDRYLLNFSFKNHSFIGIGILKEDLKYVSLKNKILCSGSLLLSALTNIIPGLKNHSDSLYIRATRKSPSKDKNGISEFLLAHHSSKFDNLNVVKLLKCPQFGTALLVSKDRKKVLSEEAGIYYPIINNIPIMIASEACKI